jgi:hypothetical protein
MIRLETYRAKAREARDLAAQAATDTARAALEQIATMYERLADHRAALNVKPADRSN